MNLDTVHVARADKVIYRDGDTVISFICNFWNSFRRIAVNSSLNIW